MEKITISSQYTDSKDNLIFWAKEKGWREKITVTEEYTDVDPNGVEGIYTRIVEKDNPVTVENFILSIIEGILLKEISEPINRYIDNTSKEQSELQKEQYMQTFNNNLTIEVK